MAVKMFETWYKMMAMLNSGLNIDKIITHKFDFREFQKGFDVMNTGQSGKVVLDWTTAGKDRQEKNKIMKKECLKYFTEIVEASKLDGTYKGKLLPLLREVISTQQKLIM